MQQALHIFRKDAFYLRGEILLVAALAAVFAWKQAVQWAEILLPVAAIYLISRLIHADPIPGDRQFWVTRPYQWKSLLAAKVIFILTFVNLPLLLAQLYLLVDNQFSLVGNWEGLLWSQLATTIAVWLPVAALAALTSSILPFNFSVIVLVAAGFLLDQSNAFYLRGLKWPDGIEWMRSCVEVVCLALIAFCVLYMQYRKRSTTFSRSFAIAALIVTILAVTYLPISWAMDLQSVGPAHGAQPADLRLTPTWSVRTRLAENRTSQAAFDLRLSAEGVPDGDDLQEEDLQVTLRSADGAIRQGDRQSSDRHPLSGHVVVNNTLLIPASFFERERARPLRLEATAYFTLFGDARAKTIPLETQPVDAIDGLRCGLATRAGFVYFACRSPFRWPGGYVLIQQGETVIPLSVLISYSPFPSGITLDDAIDTRWTSEISRLGGNVTVIVKKPLAHFRRDFEIDNVRLSDVSAPVQL